VRVVLLEGEVLWGDPSGKQLLRIETESSKAAEVNTRWEIEQWDLFPSAGCCRSVSLKALGTYCLMLQVGDVHQAWKIQKPRTVLE